MWGNEGVPLWGNITWLTSYPVCNIILYPFAIVILLGNPSKSLESHRGSKASHVSLLQQCLVAPEQYPHHVESTSDRALSGMFRPPRDVFAAAKRPRYCVESLGGWDMRGKNS